MKALKIFLISALLFHVFSSFIINIQIIKTWKTSTYSSLNAYGKKLIDYLEYFNTPEFIQTSMRNYAYYTGIERGYEYYSPNASNKQTKIVFRNNNVSIDLPGKTFESKFKINSVFTILGGQLENEGFRNKVIQSMSVRLFTLNPNINHMDVSIVKKEFPSLDEIQKGKPIRIEESTVYNINKN
ncbi:hypothetical protein [Chryseobacterium polytrichastri]|uniref:Uncharacterized protein n=1 Tax=Chryseobacterium polytrichastri TaxID=1302687 RepID=A0A1M6U9K4_9FLAO|nr:hypothetical protein [Chryseobacterium polytrichastri]SHK65932.1 hypothetical protein SAMN05444267_100695 [Chryseobacterium polytrichastri]